MAYCLQNSYKANLITLKIDTFLVCRSLDSFSGVSYIILINPIFLRRYFYKSINLTLISKVTQSFWHCKVINVFKKYKSSINCTTCSTKHASLSTA